MTWNDIFQIAIYLIVLVVLVKPLGGYMARVYENKSCGFDKIISPLERLTYRMCRINPSVEMNWKEYLISMLLFNLLGFLFVYLIQRLQFYLPLNPQHLANVGPTLSFNTAVSFITNTDWQAYSGETTMSYFTQMVALTVQNFVSAATGMSLLVALIRGIARREKKSLGNFWHDMVRSVYYILIPLSVILALFLASQGVIQNFKPYQKVHLLSPVTYQESGSASVASTEKTVTEQTIPMGPVASQEAIKQLGTNGGGFFNTNSAHPFENPTPLTDFFEMLAILLIPAALCYTFGVMVNDKRQGWAIFAAMMIVFVPLAGITAYSEQHSNPNIAQLAHHGNMEGKEVRFGVVNSALWATATTAASNGSVNSMHDSYTPLSGLILLFLMHLGEVIFGGVGCGLYGMLMLVIVTVFVAGLMIGRTPEYLGKKIEPFEMKMASVAVLVMPLAVLFFTAVAVVTKLAVASIANPGPHGFTEILYAFTSMGNNNGSAFAGLNADTHFYNICGGIIMLLSRFWIAIPTLAIAGSLVQKRTVPVGSGTLATHTPLFIVMLIGVAVILGALSFLPALALGPIAEHLLMWGNYVH